LSIRPAMRFWSKHHARQRRRDRLPDQAMSDIV
jgi:hypothetical protein